MSKEDLIPDGWYCYTIVKINEKNGHIKINQCPYWSIDESKPYQANGYCDYLKQGDWEVEYEVTLLWDQVKGCEVNCDNGPGKYQLPEE